MLETLDHQRETLLQVGELTRVFSTLSIPEKEVSKTIEDIVAMKKLISSFSEHSRELAGISKSVKHIEAMLFGMSYFFSKLSYLHV